MQRTRSCARSPLIALVLLLLIPLALHAANPCRDCHADAFTRVDAGPHRTAVERDARFCVSCHGDPAKHLEAPEATNIIGGEELAKWSSEMRAGACASCHARDFPAWRQAAHVAEGLCWNCHAASALHFDPPVDPAQARKGHFAPTRGEGSSRPSRLSASHELCLSCHADVGAQMRMHYRHPVDNGQVSCTSCHDIHGRTTNQQQLVADAACLRCHEEQHGPFLFSHGAMENGCSSCHAPHGSAHRGQLRTAGNGVCLSCHVQTNFPTIGAISHDFRLSGGGRCWDCHSEVHGSNTTPDLNPRGRR